jgi:hypothetical protein
VNAAPNTRLFIYFIAYKRAKKVKKGEELAYFYINIGFSFTFNIGMTGRDKPGNTKGGSITVLLTSCLTGLE